jgi:hypothetical protein
MGCHSKIYSRSCLNLKKEKKKDTKPQETNIEALKMKI